MLSRIITVAATLALTAQSLAAQTASDSVSPRFAVGATHTTAGIVRLSTPALDSRMAAANLPSVASSAVTVGIGGDVRTGRLLLGAGFQTLVNNDQSNATYRTRTSGSYTLVDVGFAVLRTRMWSVYPIAGAGLTHLKINVKERADFSFNDALSRPGRELSMSGAGAVLHAGMLVERRMRMRSYDYALGLRFGVTRSMGGQQWSSDASRVSDGPRGVQTSYVRFSFSRPVKQRRDAMLPIGASIIQAVAQ